MKNISSFLRDLTKRLIAIPRRWYLVAILAVGAVVRLLHITKADIWHDEGYTMMLIAQGPLEIIERTARDVHPPLYYLTAHIWQGLFGMSEFAVRSLSLVFGLATIVLVYLIMRRLFSEGTARLTALLVAIGPFVVRYGEEARMYGMAAFFVVLATYLMVRIAAQKTVTIKLWLLYGLVIAAGLYTHYYVLFIIPVHIIYLAWCRGGIKPVISDWKWWLGNGIGALLFVPWLPVVTAQMTRVSSGFWIPPIDNQTVVNTFMQFIAFSPSHAYIGWVGGALLTLFVVGVTHTYVTRKKLRKPIGLLLLWCVLPLALVMLISLVRPVYYDRYFTYCAIALYALIAIILTRGVWFTRQPLLQYGAVVAVCCIFIGGIVSVGSSATHQMGTIGRYVSQQYQPGDAVISAELYTYFDFSYYNKTPQTTQLLSSEPLTGYGETSLLYDRQDGIVVPSLDTITTKRVWLIGKTGDKEYYTSQLPESWQLIDQLEAGDSAVRLYTTTSLLK